MHGCSGFTENKQGYLSCRTGAKGEGEMIDALSALQYPHWLMVAGAVLVVLGFIGYALRKNTEPNPKVGPKENSQRDAD